MGSTLCWDTLPYITPVWGCLPFITTSTLSHWFPVHQYVSGISVCYVGISLLSGRVWGCFPHQLGVVVSALEMFICSFLYLFVVHYVSYFDYGSDYSSSSYSGIFWPIFRVISDSGSFPDRVSSYFSSHPAAFGFWASTPPDNISLNSANRKVDQSLSDFQTGLGATAHATLDTEQLISLLPWLILFPHCQRLREMLYLCLKYVNYFSRFMAFWTRLFPSELEIQHVF